MGKAHAVAYQAVGAVFETNLRPVCEMICTTTEGGARQKAAWKSHDEQRWVKLSEI